MAHQCGLPSCCCGLSQGQGIFVSVYREDLSAEEDGAGGDDDELVALLAQLAHLSGETIEKSCVQPGGTSSYQPRADFYYDSPAAAQLFTLGCRSVSQLYRYLTISVTALF